MWLPFQWTDRLEYFFSSVSGESLCSLREKGCYYIRQKVASQCYNENNLESQIMLEYKEKDHIVWNEILLIFAVFSKMYLKSFSASTYHRNLIVVGNLHSLPFIYFLRTVKQRFSKSTPPFEQNNLSSWVCRYRTTQNLCVLSMLCVILKNCSF